MMLFSKFILNKTFYFILVDLSKLNHRDPIEIDTGTSLCPSYEHLLFRGAAVQHCTISNDAN